MLTITERFKLFRRKKFVRYGIPFLLLVVGGSFGLKEFTALKFQFRQGRLVKPEDVEKYGVTMKNAEDVTLDKEFEKIKTIDIDHWENKRGPRPWEEGQ